MLKRGYIASTAFYTSYAHSEEIIDEYIRNIKEVFDEIRDIQSKGECVKDYLISGVCHSGFGRLN